MSNVASSLEVITLFLASPGDTADERERIRRSVDTLNRLVARQNGFLLEVIGWEDIPSNTGTRAQEVINPFVRDADVFIGLLKKRFGSSTGRAESGTLEEYELAYMGFHEKTPPPEVKMYFKRLSDDDLSDPGPQLEKLLSFKNRVEKTTLYHEFDSVEALGTRVENDLAAYIYSRKAGGRTRIAPALRAVPQSGAHVLSFLLDLESANLTAIQAGLGDRVTDAPAAINALIDRGLIQTVGDKYQLKKSTEAFLAICRQVIGAHEGVHLLRSEYFRSLLGSRVSEIVIARFHCPLSEDHTRLLRKLASVSIAVTEYLLFGDTTLYDNLAKHGAKAGQTAYSQQMLFNNLLHNVLYRYLGDSIQSDLLDKVDGDTIQAQVLRIGVNAASDSGRLFGAESVMPLVRMKATQDLEMGQLITGDADATLRIGTLMMQIEEWELAKREFDQTLARSDINERQRVACLNNKGLVLEHLGRKEEAAGLYEAAIQLGTEAEEPLLNLARLRKSDGSQPEGGP